MALAHGGSCTIRAAVDIVVAYLAVAVIVIEDALVQREFAEREHSPTHGAPCHLFAVIADNLAYPSGVIDQPAFKAFPYHVPVPVAMPHGVFQARGEPLVILPCLSELHFLNIPTCTQPGTSVSTSRPSAAFTRIKSLLVW